MKGILKMRELGSWKFMFLFVFVLLFSIAVPVRGQSILLANFKGGMGGSTSSSSFLDVASVSFELGFEGDIVGEVCESPHVGCEAVSLGQIFPGAIFDYDASNSMYFADVVTGLTNGTDELLYSVIRFFNSSDALLHAGAVGNFESYALKRSPDLAGAQIDFIRVKVNSFTLSERSCCGGGGLEFTADIEWEIYGSERAQTPQELIETLAEEVQHLVDLEIINRGQGNALIKAKLQKALDFLNQGKISEAIEKLNAFIGQIYDFLDAAILTPEQGLPLIDTASAIITQLSVFLNQGVAEYKQNPDQPNSFALTQNYPNPFNPTTSIRFDLPEATHVSLLIYNSMGQQIRTLLSENKDAGYYSVLWDAKNDKGHQVGAGVYLYRVIAGNYIDTKKMILMK
jgi:hypothetical protein